MKKGYRARVKGKVQGVWYRKYTEEKARELNIKGYVKNESDGSVTVVAEGEEEYLSRFLKWLHEGSPMSRVEEVIIEEKEPEGYKSFEIVY